MSRSVSYAIHGTPYSRCSRVIEVEPRRTPVGVYTLMECSSDLMRRATISHSHSRNRIRRRFVADFASVASFLTAFSIRDILLALSSKDSWSDERIHAPSAQEDSERTATFVLIIVMARGRKM